MYRANKITTPKIFALLALIVIFFGTAFGVFSGYVNKNIGQTNSYLNNKGSFMGVISLGGHQLKVIQNNQDCLTSGIDLNTQYITTDKTYQIDSVYLKNTDKGTDLACYARWKFVATIDGVTDININEYCTTSDPNVFLNEADNYFYYVDSEYAPKSLSSSSSLCLFDQMKFKGEYNTQTNTYGSIIDEYFSGSNFKLNLTVEASDTAWEI